MKKIKGFLKNPEKTIQQEVQRTPTSVQQGLDKLAEHAHAGSKRLNEHTLHSGQRLSEHYHKIKRGKFPLTSTAISKETKLAGKNIQEVLLKAGNDIYQAWDALNEEQRNTLKLIAATAAVAGIAYAISAGALTLELGVSGGGTLMLGIGKSIGEDDSHSKWSKTSDREKLRLGSSKPDEQKTPSSLQSSQGNPSASNTNQATYALAKEEVVNIITNVRYQAEHEGRIPPSVEMTKKDIFSQEIAKTLFNSCKEIANFTLPKVALVMTVAQTALESDTIGEPKKNKLVDIVSEISSSVLNVNHPTAALIKYSKEKMETFYRHLSEVICKSEQQRTSNAPPNP